MFSILVVVRKKEHLSTEEFRRIWTEEYGSFYDHIPEVKSYKQYYLSDRRSDSSEEPIDGVAILEFESEEEMNKAWQRKAYLEASKVRNRIMRETVIGNHVTSVDEIMTIV